MIRSADHLSRLERRLAVRELSVNLDRVCGPPVGAVIGEAPGPNTSPKLPLFPLPASSAGGRLMAYSGLNPIAYLGRLARRNLFNAIPERWSSREALGRADAVLEWLVGIGARRVLLCGSRVAAAFLVDRPWRVRDIGGIDVCHVPHPSGRCRVYNDPAAKRRTGAAVRWAAGYRSTMP